MFDKNGLMFNPGWDRTGSPLADFDDVRDLQRSLKSRGVALTTQADESTMGPASLTLIDPDGQPDPFETPLFGSEIASLTILYELRKPEHRSLAFVGVRSCLCRHPSGKDLLMLIRRLAPVFLVLLASCASQPSPSAKAVLNMPSSGLITVEGGRVWYEVHGSGEGTPLLVLHGGPGIPHDYLENLEQLGDERPVVFYDQLGCGRSDRPDDQALWTRERFARELGEVREALGLREVVLYGHSWGSILAVDYLSGRGGSQPSGVRGVILAGPALSIPRWIDDSRRLITELGPEVSGAIFDAERTGKTDTEAYHNAMQVFYTHHVCRQDPWPEGLNRAMAEMGQSVYGYMNGPSEFTVTGTLKNVDVTSELRKIRRPLLFICGEHDEATPESTRYYAAFAHQASVIVIPSASHVANFDQPEAYMAALRRWMSANGL